MERIDYIERTHEYYRAQGYEKEYHYARNEDIPFTPLKKPLAESRVTLVTTASFILLDEEGRRRQKELAEFAVREYETSGTLTGKRLNEKIIAYETDIAEHVVDE